MYGVSSCCKGGIKLISNASSQLFREDDAAASVFISERHLFRRDVLVLSLLCGLALFLGCLRGATKPFWSDELSTAHIALAPSWHSMFVRSRTVDLNPPLEPIAVRLSFAIFGPHEFAGRLPSILAFACAMGSFFVFLRMRLPLAYAAAGALLLLCNTDIAAYATEARPYSLLLAGISVGLLAYDSLLHDRQPILSRIVLGVSLVVVLQAHLFGTLAAGSFVLAELVRSVRLKRVDTLTWLVLLLPWLSCVTYIPLLHIQGSSVGSAMVYEEQDRTSLRKGLGFYHHFLYLPLAPLIKVLAVLLLCIRNFPMRRFIPSLDLAPELVVLLGTLLSTPIVVTLLLHLKAPQAGFFPRYGIASVLPAFILFVGLVAWRGGFSQRLGIVFCGSTLIGCGMAFPDSIPAISSVAHYGLLSAPHSIESTGGVEGLCPGLPLVMDDALQFMEADFHLKPRSEERMIYVSDRDEALRLDHETARESIAGMSKVFQLNHHVLDGKSFLATHPTFLLLARPDHRYWMYDEMLEQHAQMVPLGRYRFAGRASDAYLVVRASAENKGVALPCEMTTNVR